MLSDRTAKWLLVFVSLLEAANVIVALVTGRPTLPAVDVTFTTTGGAVLTEVLRRSGRRRPPDPPDPPTTGPPSGSTPGGQP